MFGKLANQKFYIESEKLDIVKSHLANFPFFLPNKMMIDRLEQALDNDQKISGADASFYFHEIKEAELMKEGDKWEEAHIKAIQYYQISPFSLYHPEVIQACPDDFNQKWRDSWGIK